MPKTAAKSPEKIPQPHGGAIHAGGVPGNRGGGRPPKAFKDFLADLRRDPRVQQAIEQAAIDAGSKNFKAALDVMVRYDFDKPDEGVTLTMTNEERQNRVAAILNQAKSRLHTNGNGAR